MTAIRWYQTVHNLLGNCQQKQKNKLKSIDTMTQMSSDQHIVITRFLPLQLKTQRQSRSGQTCSLLPV